MTMKDVTPVLPPRKRDWKPGDHQIGLFIRFPDGAKIEVSVNAANAEEVAAVCKFLALLTKPNRLLGPPLAPAEVAP